MVSDTILMTKEVKICRRCNQIVTKYKKDYELFEKMHWICFHFEFEHGEFDPDEGGNDPSCPWNIIGDLENQIKRMEK